MCGSWVLHVDLDQFLASVELRRRPDLRGLPVIVGGSGDPTQHRVVVTCASYEARAFGVRAGMPLRAAARKVPDATFLPSDHPAYEQASAEVMALLRTFTPRVEVLGWDEAFLDVTTDDPEALAQRIRAAVAELGLSCSVGIGDNTLRAKIATGYAKSFPVASLAQVPAGVFRLVAANWTETMADRPTDALWGIGGKTSAKLAALGIHTVADLAGTDPERLAAEFGPTIGPWLSALGHGRGRMQLVAEPRVARGRSHSTTFPDDLTERAEIDSAVTELAIRVAEEVIADGRTITRVAVTVRTASFYTRTKIRKLPVPSTDPDEVVSTALEVLGRFPLDRPVRLLGVRVELADVQSEPADEFTERGDLPGPA